MDSDSWIYTRLSYHSGSDLYAEDSEGGDDFRAEFLCPFCAADYDVVSLYCHIDDDHPLQATNGVCPVCGKKVGMDLVRHITTQHGNFLRVQRRRRVRRGGSSSTFSILRRELREGALQYIASSSEPDPLLSSFMFNPVVADESVSVPHCPSTDDALVKESSKDDFLERKPQQLLLSEEDQVEKARRFDFVQGLLMSTILDDKL